MEEQLVRRAAAFRTTTATLLLLALLGGCARDGRPTLDALESAAAAVEDGSTRPRLLALAGWHAFLVRGDTARLAQLGALAAAEEPEQPWAQLAVAEAARRRLDDGAEAEALVAILEHAPEHPLSAFAAGRLGKLSGRGSAADRAIERSAPALLGAATLPVEATIRLATALRRVRRSRGEDPREATAAGGFLSAASVVGPFSPYRALDVRTPFPPEGPGPIAASYAGPPGIGPLALRSVALPGGTLPLGAESHPGDVLYALAVAEVPASGPYAVRLRTPPSASAAVFVDGVRVLERNVTDGRQAPLVSAAIQELPAGPHLVAVKLVGLRGRIGVELSLFPLDGPAGAVKFRAAAPGDAAGTGAQELELSADDPRLDALGTGARGLATLLAPEVGILAAYVAALDSRTEDREGAKRLAAEALTLLPRSAPLRFLRAELLGGDPTLPQTIAQARAAAELEQGLALSPNDARALLRWAASLRRAGRFDEALEKVELAEAAAPGHAPAAMARARVQLARGFDLLARESALEAERREPGRCATGELLHDLARRADSIADADAAARSYLACPGGRSRLLRLHQERGQLPEALALARTLRSRMPLRSEAGLLVADVLLASGKPAEAAAVVAELEQAFPLSPVLPRRRAELLDRAGDPAGAHAARRRTLTLDGSDLTLRRAVAREQGADLLADVALDGLAAIDAYERSGRSFDTQAVILLDFGAVEAYADGSAVERVHTVAQVLDKRGIDEYGEVRLPQGAEVIRLRTIKRDRRILEPETIAEKATISLPGLEVGDYVEWEYLAPIASRGPALPGWVASPFYFRVAEVPLLESIYVVRAEPGAGLVLDGHNGEEPPAAALSDGWLRATLHVRDNPALVGEPRSPGRSEYLPWVQAGAGAGDDRVPWSYADGFADDAGGSFELSSWARAIRAANPGLQGDALIRAVYERAMAEIPGEERGHGVPAAHVLAARRGNRLLLLKAALAELGIESRFALVRTFWDDPSPRRFPDFERFAHVVLAVELGGGQLRWLDPTMRWAPYGELAPSMQGAAAWLLPAPGGGEPQAVVTPAWPDSPAGREIELTATLSAEGELSGIGEERFLGFEGAGARQALEQLDEANRKQRIEAALAKSFKGLTLEKLEVRLEGPSGAPVSVRYRFRAPGFARDVGDGRAAVDLGFFAAQLGQRYLARGSRETPLLIPEERTVAKLTLTLPPGAKVLGGTGPSTEAGPFGSYRRQATLLGSSLEVTDELQVQRGRIAPKLYPELARWISAVDRAQRTELVLTR